MRQSGEHQSKHEAGKRMLHIEEIEDSRPWTEEEMQFLIGLSRDGGIQAKLEGMYRKKSDESVLCVSAVAIRWLQTCLRSDVFAAVSQPVRWVNNVARSKRGQIWSEQESDLNQMSLQSERSFNVM